MTELIFGLWPPAIKVQQVDQLKVPQVMPACMELL